MDVATRQDACSCFGSVLLGLKGRRSMRCACQASAIQVSLSLALLSLIKSQAPCLKALFPCTADLNYDGLWGHHCTPGQPKQPCDTSS